MFKKILPQSNISIRDNLVWLFRLRNVTISAESLLMLISIYGLEINLPQEQLWLVITAICSVNLYTWMRLKTNEPTGELEVFFQIILDVLALTSLLYLTGGASNPIVWVFLLPVILTAIMLPQAYVWNMVILTCCMYTVLIGYNTPLPSIEPHIPDPDLVSIEMQHYLHDMQNEQFFNLHIFGMWFGFIISAGLVAFFVVELSKTLKERERNLAEARENALRDERVISLGTLAASAAHDMGTPLGTMAILTHEMEIEYPKQHNYDLNQKIKILSQQIVRCKEALSVLSASAGEMRAESGKSMTVIEYFDEVLNLWRAHNITTKLNLYITPAAVDFNASIIADRTLTHSIINILNNAAQVSPSNRGVDFNADWDEQFLTLKIRDFGPGFPAEIIDFAGKQPVVSNKQGLGVGLFLTYTTINRLGGKINFTNIASEEGACVEIIVPLLISVRDEETAKI
ncbi:MAG: HAMP domain-containing histidine kinase [Methylococcales symbiont of Iophon sp. n. MRB-2018]|nr:MAG: HAMP domain-containing histidine kinase [Methylococcales symbiont of Iophon sp. n. MRB-2018]KAF3978874.1 MAG: HAMP domain-containing histidine kinase [Methylococcales symbiont of Iophon sp. n. MRB-2018]